jgi:hypothetical protein
MCVSDGALDFSAYEALSTRITWDEAIRISTALTVIGDEREDYTEWRKEREKRGARSSGSGGQLTVDGVQTERDQQAVALQRVRGMLSEHRAWVATQGEQGRAFTDEQLTTLETMEETHARQIAGLDEQLALLGRGQGVERV